MRAIVGGILEDVQCSTQGLHCNIMHSCSLESQLFPVDVSILRMCLLLIQPLFSSVPRHGQQILPRHVAENFFM